MVLTSIIACSALLAATAIAQPQLLARNGSIFAVRVSGRVYGEDVAQREAGREVMAPLAGVAVSCGGSRAVTDASGFFSLTELRGRAYACALSSALYRTATASISPQFSGSYALDFGAPGQAGAGGSCVSTPTGQRCGALTLSPGAISGVAIDSDTRQTINSASVMCWDNSLAARLGPSDPARYSGVAGATGQYLLENLPVGPYVCVAGRQGALQSVVVRPGAVTSLDLATCEKNCSGVVFHQGDVMRALAIYVIYWVPAGAQLDQRDGDARYRALVSQFLDDLGGSAFYGLLTQYWDINGPVRNAVRLAGDYTDTRPYPTAASRSSPLNDKDIAAEVTSVASRQHWAITPQRTAIALFTAYGAQICADYQGQRSCSFPTASDVGFCAYHSYTTYSSDATGNTPVHYLPYMLVANVSGCDTMPTFSEGPAPYGAPAADAAIDSLSHELFETVTDPNLQGWFESADMSEIGDKCETSFGALGADGSTVTLAHGHGYALQREWSNSASACTYG